MQKHLKVYLWLFFLLILSIGCQKLAFTPNSVPPIATITLDQSNAEEAPNSDSAKNSDIEPTPTAETFNLSKKKQRIILNDLWKVVNQEYLYEDFNGVDWPAQKENILSKINQGLSDQAFYTILADMIYDLGDEHSAYLSPADVEAEDAAYEGNDDYVGIGVYVASVPDEKFAVILLVMEGGPAEKMGLKAHDMILSADGEPVIGEDGYLLETLLGEEGSDVAVLVQTPGQEPREVVITRGRISGGLPVIHQIITSEQGKKIGYLLIPSFADGAVADKIGDALQALGELDGLIIDNRLNDGGYDNMLNQTLSFFLAGNVGAYVNRDETEKLIIEAHQIQNSQSVPIVVLVGIDTVSFGEVFAGVMQDQKRATIIGETTLGNVEILWGYDFSDGSRAWIAHDTFIPSINKNMNWEADGIIPEIEVIVGWHEVTLETDPAVQAAVDLLVK